MAEILWTYENECKPLSGCPSSRVPGSQRCSDKRTAHECQKRKTGASATYATTSNLALQPAVRPNCPV